MDEERIIEEPTEDHKGLTEEQEKALENELKEQLERARNQGLIGGARMVASVVLSYASKNKVPYNKRINSIIRFCRNVLDKSKDNAKEAGLKVEEDSKNE